MDDSLNVSFNGWRQLNSDFKSWSIKMSSLHRPTWQKAGIFEAVIASTKVFNKNTDLVMGVAERWCPDTNTFLFPWGEATITLEDVMLLLGFSVLGSPHFAAQDSSGEETVREIWKEWRKIQTDNRVGFVTQVTWMGRFMDSGDELEHVAFLALWLSYFVLPTRYNCVDKAALSIAVHLSKGTRIALAPPVLAHLYADLTLLKDHIIRGSKKKTDKLELCSLFKLVQVWTWERFRELRPSHTNPLQKGEPRLALWGEARLKRTRGDVGKRRESNVRKILANSKMDSFEWRPYTNAVKNWKFPQFYPEEAMCVSVGPDLDEEFISFARCIKVSELVGIHSVEHYFPNRVASQFGMLQDVPCPVNQSSLFKEAAWDEYNKPIDGLRLCIPSRSALSCFTSMFCEWWRKDSRAAESSTPRNIIRGDDDDDTSEHVPSGSKKRKSRKRVCKDDETHMDQVPSEMDEEDDSLTLAQVMRLGKKKKAMCSSDENPPPKVLPLREAVQKLGKEFPEKLKRSRYLRTHTNVRSEIADSGGSASREVPLNEVCQKEVVVKTKSEHVGDGGDETEKRNEEANESGGEADANILIPSDDNNLSSPPVGCDGAAGIVVSPPPETMQTCDDELDVHGSTADDNAMINDASKEPDCLLHEPDGVIAGDESGSQADEINVLITSAENNFSSPPVGFDGAIGIAVPPPEESMQTCHDELNVHGSNADGDTMIDDGSKAPVCLLNEDGVIAEDETEQRVEETNEGGSKAAEINIPIQSYEYNSSDPLLASEGASEDKRGKAHKSMGLSSADISTQGQDSLPHDDGHGSEEAMKSKEQLEDLGKSNDEGGVGHASVKQNLLSIEEMAKDIEERIMKAQKRVAWLKARKAMKQRNVIKKEADTNAS